MQRNTRSNFPAGNFSFSGSIIENPICADFFAFLRWPSYRFAIAQPVKVEVVNPNDRWQLLRDGEPYYLKGAGGRGHLNKLVGIGGKSFRTWSADNGREILNKAHEHGLTVMMGLWVQHCLAGNQKAKVG